ncbi:MAG: DUF2909 domain-containing protein [Gammaproteobacteria bacterium]|nr:DUF2909 domain-containing protein [Gammaproteobacteria bacterium]
MFKIFIVTVLLFIIYSLGVALFAFVKEGKSSDKMLKALTIRIALSIGLLIFMMLGAQFGLISPHGM